MRFAIAVLVASLLADAALEGVAFGPSGRGTKIWSFQTGNSVWSSPALSNDGKVLYVGSNDNNVYAINALDGTELWNFRFTRILL